MFELRERFLFSNILLKHPTARSASSADGLRSRSAANNRAEGAGAHTTELTACNTISKDELAQQKPGDNDALLVLACHRPHLQSRQAPATCTVGAPVFCAAANSSVMGSFQQTTMPQTVGANVARAARVADAFAVADSNAKSTGKLSATAKWHEQQSIRTLSKSLQRQRDKESYVNPHPFFH